MRHIVCVGRRLSVCVRALCTLDQLWRARIDSKSLCWRRTMRARCPGPICLPFNIKLFAARSTPRTHCISLLLCIYTQCMEPAQSIGGYWVHTPGPAAGTWTIGPETKALQFNSTLSPLAPHQISLASNIQCGRIYMRRCILAYKPNIPLYRQQ